MASTERRVLLAPPPSPALRRGWPRSFVAQILELQDPLPRQEIWMLRQNDSVRQSYVRDVLAPDTDEKAR